MIDLNQFMRRTQADKLYVKKDEADELLKGSMQSVTYAELKALRDNGQLVAGRQYRITDYECTTTQENTRSAGHQFDIIVTADSESVLNENARAIQHEEKVEIWTGTFKPEILDGDKALVEGAVTKYFDIYEDFGEDKGTNYKATDVFIEYGYAENNLGVTVPVLYKTDVEMMEEGADYADTYFYAGRYEYNGETYDRWRKIESSEEGVLTWDSTSKVYALTNIIVDSTVSEMNIADTYFEKSILSAWKLKYSLDNDNTRFRWAQKRLPAGGWFTSSYDSGKWNYTGRTYEYNGEIYYVFYNDLIDITMFSSVVYPTETNHIFIEEEGELYPLAENSDELIDYGINEEVDEGKGVIYYMKDEWNNECPYDFKNIQYLNSEENYVYTFGGTDDDTLDNHSSNNIIKGSIDKKVEELNYNTFGGYCVGNILDYNCSHNTFGTRAKNNTLGIDCTNNIFYNSTSNTTLGNTCRSNTIGGSGNTFGDKCDNNIIGDSCPDNTFGSGCSNNTFVQSCSDNTLGNDCINCYFKQSGLSNNLGAGCSNIRLQNAFNHYNTFGSGCSDIELLGFSHNNSFGARCIAIKLVRYSRNVIIDNGVDYISFETDTNDTKFVQNVKVRLGVHGSSTANPLVLNVARNNDFETEVVSANKETIEV